MENINVQAIKTSTSNFFLIWLKLLQPFLKLRKQEQLVLSKLLYERYTFSLQLSNETIINDLLFSTKVRKKMQDELEMEGYSFNNVLSSLRKKNIIIGNTLNKKVIPKVEKHFKNFKLVYDFEIIQK